jgi:predicted nuclease of predicted toxin-antitoxin system/type II secretory pathway pseudopilin PulG
MKLLLDENLSRRLVPFLQAEFPGTTQVALAGLECATDLAIWAHARDSGYVIVTRDADFEELSTIHGAPPRVIWIRGENMSKAAILNLLLTNRSVIEDALGEDGVACVELGLNIQRKEGQQKPGSSMGGFTLIELAIVMFIVSLLIGGMLLPLSAQQEVRSRQETEKVLADIRDALIGFAITNGRLPRPATSATNGAEVAAVCADDAACSGFVPWAALGTAKIDGWGKLIRYSVTPAFANATITLSTIANRTVQTRDSAGTVAYLAGGASCTTPNQCVPAVIFSHGKSRWGTTDAGLVLVDGSATNADEDVNETGPTNYFSRSPGENTGVTGGEFDDITIWLSGNTLFNRMVAAGKLP